MVVEHLHWFVFPGLVAHQCVHAPFGVFSVFGVCLLGLTLEVAHRVVMWNVDQRILVVGELERIYYAPEGVEKFEEPSNAGSFERVYRNKGVSIYRYLR